MCRISLHLSNRKNGYVLLYVYTKNSTETGDFGAVWSDLFEFTLQSFLGFEALEKNCTEIILPRKDASLC